MEGIYFYWIFWIGWIYCTFMLDKTRKRIAVTVAILFLIIFSTRHVIINDIIVNCSTLLGLLIGYYFISKSHFTTILYYLSISLILTCSYVSFRLFQLYDPVWVMFNPTIKLAAILILLTLVLIREHQIRIALLLITVAQGEIIYSLFLNSIVGNVVVIGHLESLDIVAITIAVSYLWLVFEKMVALLDDYVKQRTVLSSQRR
ncbi:MAG: hypothetical protein ACK4M9_15500 [Anaerobacillus sp.]|uniref:YphA family membrane protein n=1 Tax=Anaerobacillus sp. TaxID=1872506 RepID=UPI0039190A3B